MCIGSVFLLWQYESCEFLSATLCVGRAFHFLVAQKLRHEQKMGEGKGGGLKEMLAGKPSLLKTVPLAF